MIFNVILDIVSAAIVFVIVASERRLKKADKASIEQIIADIDALVETDNLTADEIAALGTVKTCANALLQKINDATDDSENQEIEDAASLNKDNVRLGDKEALSKAEAELEAALNNFEHNYTENELTVLKALLTGCKAPPAAIESSGKVTKAIDALPEAAKVTASDKGAITAAKATYDALSENEKAMVSTEYVSRLNTAEKALAELGKDGGSPKTGDTGMALLLALILACGGVLSVFGSKKARKGQRRVIHTRINPSARL